MRCRGRRSPGRSLSMLTGSGPNLVQGDQPAKGAEAYDRDNSEPFLQGLGQGQGSRLGHLLRYSGLLTSAMLRQSRIPRPWELLLTCLRGDNPAFIGRVLSWCPLNGCIVII